MSPSAAEKSAIPQFGVGDADLDVRLVGEPLCRRAIHADGGQHAAREVVGAVHPHRVVGELHHRRLEVGGVVVGAGLVGGSVKPSIRSFGGVERVRSPRRRCAGCPPMPRPAAPVNTVGAIAASSAVGLRRQRLRAQDQVGFGGRDACDVGLAAGADARARRGSPCRDTTAGCRIRRAAPRRRCATAGPARTARRVGHRTARRCAADPPCTSVSPAAWRTVDGPAVPGSSARGFGRARFVGPALIAQHAGAGDLGGAGDRRDCAGAAVAAGFRPVIRSRSTAVTDGRRDARAVEASDGTHARPLISTSPTVTSGLLAAGAAGPTLGRR